VTFHAVVDVIQSYGWYMLLSGVVLYYLMSKIWPTIENYWNHRQEQAYIAKYHKNPDLLTERIVAQEKLSRKLQEKYNRDVELRKEKLKEVILICCRFFKIVCLIFIYS